MKKQLLLAVASLLFASLSQAADEQKIKDTLEKLLPGMKVESVADSAVPGLLQVVVDGQLVYVSEDGRYLIQGSVYDTQTREDITEAAKSGLRKKLLDQVDIADKIVFPAKGEKTHTITVFTDIDCGYCRKLHSQIEGYQKQGIEVQYMAFPRAGIGSGSYDKAVSVWCADDRQKAITNAKQGSTPPKKTCDNPVAEQYNLGKRAGVTGTPAIVTGNGQLIPGYMPPEQLKARLDQLKAP